MMMMMFIGTETDRSFIKASSARKDKTRRLLVKKGQVQLQKQALPRGQLRTGRLLPRLIQPKVS
jgi:hypothetical protein